MRFASAAPGLAIAVLGALLCHGGMRLTSAQNLYPRPDALEYAMAAVSLADGHGFLLDFGQGGCFQPRYTPGFPLLIAATYRLFGVYPEAAWMLTLGMYAACLCLIHRIALMLGGPIAGLAAVLIAALSSAFQEASCGVMCDAPALFFILAGMALLVHRQASPSEPLMTSVLISLLAGVCLGYAACIRPTSLFFIPGAMLFLALSHSASCARLMMIFSVGIVVGLSPTGWFNWVNTGSLFANSYALWAPEFCRDPLSAYSLNNLTESMNPRKWPNPNGILYFDALLGINGYAKAFFYGIGCWPLALAAFVGLRKSNTKRERAFLLAMGLSGALLLGHYLLFFWQDIRFILPLLPFVAIAAGLGGAAAWKQPSEGFRRAWRAFAVIFLLLTFYPGLKHARDNLQGQKPKDLAFDEVALCCAIHPLLEEDAILITNLDDLMVQFYLVRATGRVHIPLSLSNSGAHLFTLWQWNIPTAWGHSTPEGAERWRAHGKPVPLFAVDPSEKNCLEQVKKCLEEGKPVYFLDALIGSGSGELQRLHEMFDMAPVAGETQLHRLYLRGAVSG